MRRTPSFLLCLFAIASIIACAVAAFSQSQEKPPAGIPATPATPESQYPKQVGLVNDFAHTLPEALAQNLETSLQEYRKQQNVEIVLVICATPQEMKDAADAHYSYADKLLRAWKVGGSVQYRGGSVMVAFTDAHFIAISTTDANTGDMANPAKDTEFMIAIKQAAAVDDFSARVRYGLAALMNALRVHNIKLVQARHRAIVPHYRPAVPHPS